jgi:hypothetical protein
MGGEAEGVANGTPLANEPFDVANGEVEGASSKMGGLKKTMVSLLHQ